MVSAPSRPTEQIAKPITNVFMSTTRDPLRSFSKIIPRRHSSTSVTYSSPEGEGFPPSPIGTTKISNERIVRFSIPVIPSVLRIEQPSTRSLITARAFSREKHLKRNDKRGEPYHRHVQGKRPAVTFIPGELLLGAVNKKWDSAKISDLKQGA